MKESPRVIFSATRILQPHEYKTLTNIIERSDRSAFMLRVLLPAESPARAFELRASGKDFPNCINVNLHDENDDVVSQAMRQPKLLDTFKMEYLGAEYRLTITRAKDVPGNKKAAKKRATPGAPKPSAEERAARTIAYAKSGCSQCPNCQSTSIVKSPVIGERCQVRCKECKTRWLDYSKFMALEDYHLEEAMP